MVEEARRQVGRNRADFLQVVGVLAVPARIIEELVFPHVQVQHHDEGEDAVVEPFASHVHSPIANAGRNVEGEGSSV